MQVLVTTERRYFQTPDGRVWTPNTLPYEFWQRYLGPFEAVRVLARVRPVPEVQEGWRQADGADVTVSPVPDFVGPSQYVTCFFRVNEAIRRAVSPGDAVIFRAPSHLSMILFDNLNKAGHPFAMEVIGDPFDVFSPGVVSHAFRRFFRRRFTRGMQRQCLNACAVAYVTESALQRRYPTSPGAYSTHYSSVELPRESFAERPRTYSCAAASPMRLITVGTLEQLYKAPDVLIDAVALCVRQGLDLDLTLVGEGRFRKDLEMRAEREGIGNRVRFAGQMPAGDPVRRKLDASDLFVLPSRTEALPRALLEAMSRGMACVASDVGGIGEVLAAQDLVSPGNASLLAAKLSEVLQDPARLDAMALRNFSRAQDFLSDTLSARRAEFYQEVFERTQAVLSRGRA